MSSINGTRHSHFTPDRIADSFAYCERLTRAHYENFPVGSLLVPAAKRHYVYAIYAFARIADDMADEGYDEAILESARLHSLNDWERQLQACLTGGGEHPVFPALAATIHETSLPVGLLVDLVSAFKQDVVKRRYQAFAEVVDYCRRSANPVGRLILLLFGYRDETRALLSDSICTALQLANLWQDVSVDIRKDRIYIPQEDLARFDVTEREIRSGQFTSRFAELLSFEVSRTRELFEVGRPLLDMVTGRLRYELRLTWLGGMSILDKIEGVGFDTLALRPSLGRVDKIRLLTMALLNRL
jgi:phytoene synthase